MLKSISLLIGLIVALPLQGTELAPTGTLRAAFIANNPVQGRVDPQTGAISGPVAELVRELANRLGVPFRISPTGSAEAVIAEIKTRRADIGFVTYNEERAREVDFSDVYVVSGSTYLVRADSNIKASGDVDRSGVTVGAIKGQTQQLYVYISGRMKSARVEVLPEAPSPDAVAAMLISGRLDVFGANRERMEEAARTSSRLRVLRDNFMVTAQAIVVEKGHRPRIGELNRFLADVKGSGFVKTSLDRANVAGVEVAPLK